MTSTKVKCKCISKKESIGYYGSNNPITTTIELQVPYDQNSIYCTGFNLNTVNQEAADMFIIGNDYDVVISPSQD